MTIKALIFILHLVLGNQPYSLTVQSVSPALRDLCNADDNCMDIVSIEEAVKRAGY